MSRFKLSPRFLKFCIVGTVGFFVEATIIQSVKYLLPDLLLYVRLVSFPVAVFATWLLNRLFVFESNNSKLKEVSKYLVVQTSGAVINIAVYTLLLLLSPLFKEYPIIALATGSGVALISNYIFSKIWAFR